MPDVLTILDGNYLILFLGLFIGGESILIPAIYLTLIDRLSIAPVAGLAILGALLSDTAWYLIGRYLSNTRLATRRFNRTHDVIVHGMKQAFRRHGALIVIGSKFLYGSRTIVQILAGAEELPYPKFITANLVGVSLWIGILYALGWTIRGTLEVFELSIARFQIMFAAIFFIVIVLFLWLSKRTSMSWFR